MNEYCHRLYARYRAHMGAILGDHLMREEEFSAMVSPQLAGMKLVKLDENASQGFLFFREWDDGSRHAEIPVWGYDAGDRKTLVRLFQALAEDTVTETPCEFSVDLYSTDAASIQTFSLLQFGIMSETCVRRLGQTPAASSPCEIRPLTKQEIRADWPRLWDATGRIIAHLRESPVFYPGNEFTEEMYREFYLDDATELLAAYDGGRLAGIIEWNREANGLLSPAEPSANIGEAFVYPEYRGTGLARQLLQGAENAACAAGMHWLWVQHGTANPNACGFWNKYFQTYQYEMVRTIAR